MWVLIAIVAYFFMAANFVFDKIVLRRVIVAPIVYAIYVGLSAVYGVLFMPFGFSLAGFSDKPWWVIPLAFFSGAAFILSLIPLYKAIQKYEVSRVAPFIGLLTALFILALTAIFSVEYLDVFELLIFAILIIGALLVSRPQFTFLGVLSALSFAISFVAIKAVYQNTTFINGFILARFGEFIFALILFLLPAGRRAVKESWGATKVTSLGLVAFIKIFAGLGFVIQNYAIFLGSVALVHALSGIQYVFVWLIVTTVHALTKKLEPEQFSWATIIVIIGFMMLALSQKPTDLAPGVRAYGVTFSKPWAEQLGLNWRNAYLAALDDLGIRKLRLPAYWNEIEKQEGSYNFSDLDWQIREAKNRGAEIILVVGRRVPRWPECHVPPWAENSELEIQNSKLLNYIETIVKRYKNEQALVAWQVENEPFLKYFGLCPDPDSKMLDQEIDLVKSLDNRPIVITDSGELGGWARAARRADIFGTTMYGVVYRNEPPRFYIRYPRMPSLFHFKANLARASGGTKNLIISELQAEPWGPGMIYDLSPEEQQKSMNLGQLQSNLRLAREVGFREVYLWGVEWWYQELLEGRPEFWIETRKLFK